MKFGFNTPFAEQLDFFRQKLNLPSERWDDIQKAAHDRAFIVAGARWGAADGQVMFILVITLAAAEASIGLAILLQLYRRFHTLDIDAASEMRG